MATVLHPILGAVEPSAPGFWDATVTFGGHAVRFDLTIDGSDLAAADLNDLPQKAEDLMSLDRKARAAILHDAQSGDEDAAAQLYITHHQSVLSASDFQRLFGTSRPDPADFAAILSRVVLVRVGLYPEDADRRVLLDYSIDPDATNYLLCVSFDSGGEPTAVDLES
jgi:hypothetical protein